MRATQAVIRLDNLRHNIRALRAHIGAGVAICMAVKADAYGHGAVPVSRTALEEGVKLLGVATVEEGAELRAAGIRAPILLLGLPFPEEASAVIENDITPFVATADVIRALAQAAAQRKTRRPVHLKVDTGMGRIGCAPEEAPDLAALITGTDTLVLEGVATHFPVSDSAAGDPFTREQTHRLKNALSVMEKAGIRPAFIHAANSGALIDKTYATFNLARPGIILYGYYPSNEQKRALSVHPVLELVTKISFIKRVPAGTGISYGLTHTVARETLIATLPVGYGDGYSRLLSNRAEVWADGRRCPVTGRVCMDQTMIDLGPDSTARVGDRVILFGPTPGAPDAAEIAALMGTIPYEVTCLISKRVPRVYRDDSTIEP
jgi:alanine racemase